MQVLCEVQGTPEWLDARRCKITASAAKFALGRPGTKGRAAYVLKLVHDLEGVADFDDEDDKPWYAEGRYFESWARGWYSWNFDADVRETGFVVHDDYGWLGCSPDGMIDPDGMIQIKYRKALHTFHEHSSIGINASVKAQMQTELFVTGRRWNDYVNYWRSDDHEVEQGRRWRMYRDDAYIDNTLLPAFVKLWADVQALYSARN